MVQKLLTKSLYITGLQCPKLLWIKAHEKERIPKVDKNKQARFDTGYQIENLAKKLFSQAKDANSEDFRTNLNKTAKLVNSRETILEASFLTDRLYSRADVLEPNPDNTWNFYEIKSSTKVKETHLNDIAFQKYTYQKAGIEIKNCFLIIVNNQYTFEGELDIKKLFKIENVTKEIIHYSKKIEEKIKYFLEILDSKEEPNQEIGMHCDSPYECPLKKECWNEIHEISIFDLYNSNQKSFELFEKGINRIEDIPMDYPLTPKQLIQKACIIENKEHVNKKGIKDFLDRLEYPLYYLDFETINPAIPKYIGMRPFQRIPFQYSLHIQENENASPKHISFLHKEDTDPRTKFIKSLKETLGERGSIVVYNKGFEESILNETTKGNTELEKWTNEIRHRMIDLLEPFRKFDYYNKSQGGATSIKKVLPALSNLSYNNLEIAKGEIANLMYEKTLKEKTTKEEKEKIFENLEEYCKLDTLAEYEIIKGLKEKITKD